MLAGSRSSTASTRTISPTAESRAPPEARFVLAHVGTLYGVQDPDSCAAGPRRAHPRAARSTATRVEVRLVGNVWIPGFAPPPGVRVERTGYVEHARAIAEMRAATALMLYVPAASLAPSGKLFEYLGSGRPVLCLARPDNLASRLVREWDSGVVADPHDEQAIEEALLALWRRWLEGGLPDQAEVRARVLDGYSRKANADQLAAALEEARRA